MSELNRFFSDAPEIQTAAHTTREQRTRLGQVFTPYAIAKCMAQWVSARRSPASVLDPALGLGVFLRCLLEDEKNAGSKMTGFEVDPETAAAAKHLFESSGYAHIKVENSNYLEADWESKFDAILCNPPYRKFRGLPDKEQMATTFMRHTGITFSRAANLYIFFLIKLIWQLAEGGRAAVILPFEFLNADYGVPVKQLLLDHGILRKVLILGEALQPFTVVITTACILCLERSAQSNPPEFVTVHSMEELSAIAARFKHEDGSSQASTGNGQAVRSPGEKWLVPMRLNQAANKKMVPLSTFGKVMRGIATGDNAFFVISEAQREQAELDEECVLPCLAKSSYAADLEFSQEHFSRLRASQKPVWLVNLAGWEDLPAVERYIEYGLARGTDMRFLTSKRSPWYALEQRPAAPLLVTTFSRGKLRWVRNRAGVRNLTAFHGFYPHTGVDLDLLCAYLVTPLAQERLTHQRREYGNGLHKYEPNDLNRAMVMDVRAMGDAEKCEVCELYGALLLHSDDELLMQLDEAFRRFDR
ncbi:MAG TPA: N-6 DNA methylase [Bellilinea sp.]|nr:N-6 DNA methylase [Bellilinea sp.]